MLGVKLILLLPLIGAILVWMVRKRFLVNLVAISLSLFSFLITLFYYLNLDRTKREFQFIFSYRWISAWNLDFSVGFDHINAPFVLLTTLITTVAVVLSAKTIREKLSSYMALLLLLSFFVNTFFMSTNFLQFFFFYEAMLIPSVLLIQRWGGRNAYEASLKFLLYTFGFSLFLFIAIIAVYFYGGGFRFDSLSQLSLTAQSKMLLFISFLLAFFVKIPIVPLHGWLREAYYEAPMPMTIFMSSVLSKMGVYGTLRIAPYFSDTVSLVSNWIVALCVFSFIYSAFVALTAKNTKIMFSYMSLSHIGMITAGVFTGNILGYQGALLQSINHGLLSAGFFYIAELLQRQTQSFDSEKFGGLSKRVPALTFFTFALIMAMAGFPGLNYFNGELLLLSGIFKENIYLGFFSVFGVALGVLYLAWFFYRVFLRKPAAEMSYYVKDVSSWEFLILLSFFLISIYLGLNPDFVLLGLKDIISFGGKV